MGTRPLFHDLLRPRKKFRADNLEVRQHLGFAFAVSDNPNVNWIFHNTADRIVENVFPFLIADALLHKVTAKPEGLIALIDVLLENQLDHLGLIWLHYQIPHRPVLLAHSP